MRSSFFSGGSLSSSSSSSVPPGFSSASAGSSSEMTSIVDALFPEQAAQQQQQRRTSTTNVVVGSTSSASGSASVSTGVAGNLFDRLPRYGTLAAAVGGPSSSTMMGSARLDDGDYWDSPDGNAMSNFANRRSSNLSQSTRSLRHTPSHYNNYRPPPRARFSATKNSNAPSPSPAPVPTDKTDTKGGPSGSGGLQRSGSSTSDYKPRFASRLSATRLLASQQQQQQQQAQEQQVKQQQQQSSTSSSINYAHSISAAIAPSLQTAMNTGSASAICGLSGPAPPPPQMVAMTQTTTTTSFCYLPAGTMFPR